MPTAEHASWVSESLGHLEHYGPQAAAALQYMRQHGTRLGVHDQPTGARWTIDRRIELHPHYLEMPADDPYAISLIIHEVRHLQQGPLTALSVYGELEAWQLQFGFLKDVLGYFHADARRNELLGELMVQPLGGDRGVLQHARELIQQYAGKKYRIDLLPLYPVHRELAYRVGLLRA
jgi:hypothetical protein